MAILIILFVLFLSCINAAFALDENTTVQTDSLSSQNQAYNKTMLLISDNSGTILISIYKSEVQLKFLQ